MGEFLDARELVEKTTSPQLKTQSDEALEDMWILPAERAIEEFFHLSLDTDMYPIGWRGLMLSRPSVENRYRDDFRRAILLYIERKADNQYGRKSESAGGVSVVHSFGMPSECIVLMSRWGRQGEVRR